MLAAVLEDVRRMPLKEVPVPKVVSGTALIRVKACGICQTDFSAYTGARRNWTPGIIVGHEFSGVIEEVGEGVKRFRPGDEVIVSPAVSCGVCEWCKTGHQNYCPDGFAIGGEGYHNVWNGGFAEYTLVPEVALYHKPPEISFEAAALTEPLAGSYKGLIEYSQMRVGEDVVIIGGGGMGLLLAEIALAAGAGTLAVVDIDEYKLERARSIGVKHVINSRTTDIKKAVYDLMPKGPDLVFEAAGALAAAEQAFALCRRGTRLNMFGVIIPGTIPVSPADIHFLETRVDASFSVTPRVMIKAIDLMNKQLVDPAKIVTHRIPLSRMDEALRVMESLERIKVVVVP